MTVSVEAEAAPGTGHPAAAPAAPSAAGEREHRATPARRPALSRVRLVGGSALPLLLVLGLVALSPGSALAQGDDDATAVTLLRRAMQAAGTLSYSGMQVVATWTPAGSTTRMIEIRQQGGAVRSLTVRGTGQEGASTTVLPVGAASGVPAVDAIALIAAAYQVALGGQDLVAGRPSQVVIARRSGRVAAQLWLDDATGLLLREEVYDLHGRLIRMASFVNLQPQRSTGARSTSAPAAGDSPAGAGRRGYGTPAPASVAGDFSTTAMDGTGSQPAALRIDPAVVARRLGCYLPATLPGGFRLLDARAVPVGGSGGTAVQLTYSDGLSGLSVFWQNGRLPASGVPGLVRQSWGGVPVYLGSGWPARVVWQGHRDVLTAITDAPLDEVRAVVAALPRPDQSSRGVLGRLAAALRAAMYTVEGR